jgi:hypothetical protein
MLTVVTILHAVKTRGLDFLRDSGILQVVKRYLSIAIYSQITLIVFVTVFPLFDIEWLFDSNYGFIFYLFSSFLMMYSGIATFRFIQIFVRSIKL